MNSNNSLSCTSKPQQSYRLIHVNNKHKFDLKSPHDLEHLSLQILYYNDVVNNILTHDTHNKSHAHILF